MYSARESSIRASPTKFLKILTFKCGLNWTFAFTNRFFFFLNRSYWLSILRRQNLIFINSVCIVHILYTVYIFKNIKNWFHDTIYIFKNYFTIVFSVFGFRNNKFNLNGPLVSQKVILPILTTYFTIYLTLKILFFYCIIYNNINYSLK